LFYVASTGGKNEKWRQTQNKTAYKDVK